MKSSCTRRLLVASMWLGVSLHCAAQPVAGSPTSSAPAAVERSLSAGERMRKYVLYVPATSSTARPLVVALHGTGMTGQLMRRWTGEAFERLADKYGFVVAYPDAVGGSWHDCRGSSAWRSDVDDVGFIRALVKSVSAEFAVDPKQVYLFGYSGGGHMAFRFSWQAVDEVAALAVVAASLPTPDSLTCTMSTRVPRTMLVLGTADRTNPYSGGPHVAGGSVLSALASAEALANRHGLKGPTGERSLQSSSAEDPTGVQVTEWLQGRQPLVSLYTVTGGGHTVPQPAYSFGQSMGATSKFDSPSAAWRFFIGQ